MRDIRITPKAQLVALLGLVGSAVFVLVAQIPEVRRYLRVRGM